MPYLEQVSVFALTSTEEGQLSFLRLEISYSLTEAKQSLPVSLMCKLGLKGLPCFPYIIIVSIAMDIIKYLCYYFMVYINI